MPNRKVLLIDDNDDYRFIVKTGLSAAGYDVTEAADGKSALHAFHSLRPDIVVTDYMMPGLSGADVAVEARNEFPNLPVVLLSGYSPVFEASIENWTAPTAMLAKPIAIPALIDRIEGLLAARGAGA